MIKTPDQEREKLMRNSISIEQVAYHEAGHALYYMMRGVVPDSIEVVDAGQGMTITEPAIDFGWSSLTQDFILLAGTVAEHMYTGDLANTLSLVADGDIPSGAWSDFSKLSETDPEVIVEMMLYLYDLFSTERWLVLSTVAEHLIQRRIL